MARVNFLRGAGGKFAGSTGGNAFGGAAKTQSRLGAKLKLAVRQRATIRGQKAILGLRSKVPGVNESSRGLIARARIKLRRANRAASFHARQLGAKTVRQMRVAHAQQMLSKAKSKRLKAVRARALANRQRELSRVKD